MPNLRGFTEADGYFRIPRNVRFGKDVLFDTSNPVGKTYYVRNTGSNSNDGLSPSQPFLTLAYAVHSKAAAWDVIVVLPASGTTMPAMLETDLPITITQNGLKIIGGMTSQFQWGSPSIHTHATTSLFVIKAHMVEIAHLGIHHQGAGTSIEIAPDSANFHGWRTHIHDCYFGGNGDALKAITVGGVGTDAPCTVIEDCYFQGYVTCNIYANCGYGSTIRRCHFQVNASAIGIEYIPNGTSRPYGWLLDNRFTTPDNSAAIGIKVTNTPTAGYLFIDGNQFNYFANDAACISKRTGYAGRNYLGITAIAIT